LPHHIGISRCQPHKIYVLFSRDNLHYSVTIIWYQNDTDLFSCSMEY